MINSTSGSQPTLFDKTAGKHLY